MLLIYPRHVHRPVHINSLMAYSERREKEEKILKSVILHPSFTLFLSLSVSVYLDHLLCLEGWWGCDPATHVVSSVVLKGRFAVLNHYTLLQTSETMQSHITRFWLWARSPRYTHTLVKVEINSRQMGLVLFLHLKTADRTLLLENNSDMYWLGCLI